MWNPADAMHTNMCWVLAVVKDKSCRYETYIVLALKNYNITVFTWLDVTPIYCTVAYTIAVGIHAVRALDDKIEANDDHLKTWPAVLRKKYAPAVDRMKFSLVTQKLIEDSLLCWSFRRESRLLDCGDSLLPSWCLAWNWSWDKGEGIGVILFYCYMSDFRRK